MGISQLEEFFLQRNEAIIDCLGFDTSPDVLTTVKNSLKENMAKLTKLTMGLVNVERFQRS